MRSPTIGVYRLKPSPNRKLLWCCRWFGLPNLDGERKRHSKSFRTRREAEDFKSAKSQELRKLGPQDRPGDDSLGKLCRDFLRFKKPNVRPATMEAYGHTIRRLLDYFGPRKRVQDTGKKQADLFVGDQLHHLHRDKELSAWSRAGLIRRCRTIFEVAVRWNLTNENPFTKCEKPKCTVRRWHHIKPDEYLRLQDVAPSLRWRCLYSVLYTTAVRIGEAFSLTWADIDFERAVLKVQNRAGTKTILPFTLKAHERRTIPLTKHTLAILAEWQAEAPQGVPHIFLTEDRYQRVLKRWQKLNYLDRQWQNRYMTNNTNRDFQVHCKRASIEIDGKCTVHTLRKSCGQNWALAGVPIKTLQYLMGHSNSETTLKYYQQVDPASAAQAVYDADETLIATAAALAAQADSKPRENGRGMDAETQVDAESTASSEGSQEASASRAAGCGNRGDRIRTYGLLLPKQAL